MWRSLVVVLVLTLPALAQSNIKVELDDVTDNRVAAGEFVGSLELRVKLAGTGLEKASAARVLIKEARDDKGTDLTRKGDPPDFFSRDYNSGTLQFGLVSPARAATRVKLKGTVELYVPARDPNAIVKIANGLAKLDAPLSSKALKAAKIELTPLSHDGYKKAVESRKIDETKIAAIRAEGKKQGVSEKEVEMMIGLAQALDASDAEIAEGSIFLAGSKDSFDKVYRIEVLGSDGKPIDTPSRSTSTRGDDAIMTLVPASAPPPNATLQLYVITQKARVSAPFELTVELP
jgi:hypothetical protein